MAFDFPNSPTNGQTFTPSGGPTYTYDSAGTKWTVSSISATVPITTGTYTPTHFLLASIDASTAYVTSYLQISDRVIVSGIANVDPAAVGFTTQLGLSLPVASNFSANEQLGGAIGGTNINQGGAIYADPGAHIALITFNAAVATNFTISFIFHYRIV